MLTHGNTKVWLNVMSVHDAYAIKYTPNSMSLKRVHIIDQNFLLLLVELDNRKYCYIALTFSQLKDLKKKITEQLSKRSLS